MSGGGRGGGGVCYTELNCTVDVSFSVLVFWYGMYLCIRCIRVVSECECEIGGCAWWIW